MVIPVSSKATGTIHHRAIVRAGGRTKEEKEGKKDDATHLPSSCQIIGIGCGLVMSSER